MSTEPSDESWRGQIGKFSNAQFDEFLAEGKTARVACLDDKGWPYVVAAWHEWDGSAFWLVARKKARWAEFLDRDRRCAITIDTDANDGMRKISAQCQAVVVERPNLGGAWVEVANRMSLRYLGEHGPDYMVPTLDKPRWLIRLDPIDLQTWQGVEWAKRYKE